ncbi:hypothetical protein NE237_021051 [Protea cynaroides]|uniref:Uncharacterized protein n=1 Tax=Protea cynaroides TaxID=273540 RepID=A0A9Q0K2X5_9MAGN|nr:hypothetical protein NE237_021051 [Protea cynaroides]
MVDENMIVLRKRIHEMKKMEKNQEPPEDWMEWEKKYYRHYNSDVYEAVGLLQTQLMDEAKPAAPEIPSGLAQTPSMALIPPPMMMAYGGGGVAGGGTESSSEDINVY